MEVVMVYFKIMSYPYCGFLGYNTVQSSKCVTPKMQIVCSSETFVPTYSTVVS
jgi:hypothetical protein